MSIHKRVVTIVVALAVTAMLALVPGLGTAANAATPCEANSVAYGTALQQQKRAQHNVTQKAKKLKKAKKHHASKAKIKKAKKALKRAKTNLRHKNTVVALRQTVTMQACGSSEAPPAPTAPAQQSDPSTIELTVDLATLTDLFEQFLSQIPGLPGGFDPSTLATMFQEFLSQLPGLPGGEGGLLDLSTLTDLFQQFLSQLPGGGDLPDPTTLLDLIQGIVEPILGPILDQLPIPGLPGSGGSTGNPLCSILPIPVLC